MFLSQLLLVAMVGIGRSRADNPIVEQLHDAEPAINAVLEQLRGTTPSKAGAGIAIADARPSNSMDVIKSAIGDAAENGRNLRTLSDATGFWTACGRNGYCNNHFASAMPSDLNYVRCCSDRFKDGWVKQGDQCPYGESNLEVANSSEHEWNHGCTLRKTYYDARAACSNVGARLCTKAELHFDCAAQSGCGFDEEMVWALSSEAIAPPPAPSPPSESYLGRGRVSQDRKSHCHLSMYCIVTSPILQKLINRCRFLSYFTAG